MNGERTEGMTEAPVHDHEWSLSKVEFDDGTRRITVFVCERCGICSRVIKEGGKLERVNDKDCDLALVESIMGK